MVKRTPRKTAYPQNEGHIRRNIQTYPDITGRKDELCQFKDAFRRSVQIPLRRGLEVLEKPLSHNVLNCVCNRQH